MAPAELNPMKISSSKRAPLFKGQQTRRAGQNKTETEYAAFLEALRKSGQIQSYTWEGIKLRVTDAFLSKRLKTTWYTPDFLVMAEDGTLECHECKGAYITEAGLLRFKAAASAFPFRFVLAQKLPKSQGGWKVETVK